MEKTDTHDILNKILNSQPFTNKEVQKGLLNYLYEAWKKGLALKEMDIAIDFFKRERAFVPGDDTIVRVNIHKLRSLLEAYYLTEGKRDSVVLEIPKGSYSLKFVKKGQATGRSSHKRSRFKILYAFLLVSLLINLVFVFRAGWFCCGKSNPVWAGYIRGGKPVNVVLGDPFFFRVNDSIPETAIVRDITINSTEELRNNSSPLFLKEKPRVSKLTYPYFSTSNVWPLPDMIALFAKADVEVQLHALSGMNVEDLKRNNVIVIANINSFGYMNKFLEQTSIRLRTNPRQIIVGRDKDSLVFSVPEFIHGYYMDYAFLVKIPGPQHNLMTMMGDFHASGIKGLTNYMASQPSLDEFTAKVERDFGKFPEYFEMVVKVVSYNYADFKTELIYFKPLKD